MHIFDGNASNELNEANFSFLYTYIILYISLLKVVKEKDVRIVASGRK
jgi:hypothetical protein